MNTCKEIQIEFALHSCPMAMRSQLRFCASAASILLLRNTCENRSLQTRLPMNTRAAAAGIYVMLRLQSIVILARGMRASAAEMTWSETNRMCIFSF